MNRSDETRSRRRHLLATLLLPSLLIATVYLLLIRPGAADNLARARESLAETRRRQPATSALGTAYGRVKDLRAQLARIRAKQLERAATRGNEADFGLAAAPIWRRGLTQLLRRHRILVVRDSRDEVERPATSGLLPGSAHRVPVRTLALIGTFQSVLGALRDLRRMKLPSILLELTMKRPGQAQKAPSWTLKIG